MNDGFEELCGSWNKGLDGDGANYVSCLIVPLDTQRAERVETRLRSDLCVSADLEQCHCSSLIKQRYRESAFFVPDALDESKSI